jgi:hypothetical protein
LICLANRSQKYAVEKLKRGKVYPFKRTKQMVASGGNSNANFITYVVVQLRNLNGRVSAIFQESDIWRTERKRWRADDQLAPRIHFS